MDLVRIKPFFPLKRILKLLLGLSLFIQVVIITYNHFSGYHLLGGGTDFLLRLLRGTLMSMFAGLIIIYPDIFFIDYLNKIFPWGKKTFKRIICQLGFTILIAVTISSAITSLLNCISPYREDFKGVLFYNALIYSVVNILMMAVMEGWFFFVEIRKTERLAKNLEEELSRIKFEVLKSQINPHFMFNSLNVLSGLIESDVVKAQEFIDEFSSIYRYVLEAIEKTVVKLEKELEFMRSYLFLQQIRYGADLSYTLNVPSGLLKKYLPPLSLQVVLENAIKHNIINELKPLKIEIYSDSECLVVKNNIQPKISVGTSTGLGLKNLVKRYSLISEKVPVFEVVTKHYIVRLPLIEIEGDENTDY